MQTRSTTNFLVATVAVLATVVLVLGLWLLNRSPYDQVTPERARRTRERVRQLERRGPPGMNQPALPR